MKALCGLPGGGVPTTYLSSQQTAADTAAVHRELGKQRPSCKLLYVTPVRTDSACGTEKTDSGRAVRCNMTHVVWGVGGNALDS